MFRHLAWLFFVWMVLCVIVSCGSPAPLNIPNNTDETSSPSNASPNTPSSDSSGTSGPKVLYEQDVTGHYSDGTGAFSGQRILYADGTITSKICEGGSCSTQTGLTVSVPELQSFKNLIASAASGTMVLSHNSPCPAGIVDPNPFVSTSLITLNDGNIELEQETDTCAIVIYQNNSPATSQIKTEFTGWLCSSTTCGQ